MWTQIIGKIRLKLGPHLNHWWQGFIANIGQKHSTLICSSPIAEDRPALLVATLGPGASRARILPGRASTRTAGP